MIGSRVSRFFLFWKRTKVCVTKTKNVFTVIFIFLYRSPSMFLLSYFYKRVLYVYTIECYYHPFYIFQPENSLNNLQHVVIVVVVVLVPFIPSITRCLFSLIILTSPPFVWIQNGLPSPISNVPSSLHVTDWYGCLFFVD